MKYPWYYTTLGWILNGMAHLPFRILYIISDVLFVIVYYIARYRRDVVKENIASSFPEMQEKEQKKVIRQFYRHFTDYFVETIKLAHITDEEMRHRMEFVGTEMIDRYFDEGRSLAMYFSHCGNWEWAPSITLWTRHKPSEETVFAQVYRPLTNHWFDAYFLKLRSRFGSVSYDKRLVFRDLLRLAPRRQVVYHRFHERPEAKSQRHGACAQVPQSSHRDYHRHGDHRAKARPRSYILGHGETEPRTLPHNRTSYHRQCSIAAAVCDNRHIHTYA